ncbi:MAG: DUF2971 domain-containing protein [Imperialibacter sp.]|uniref:DUF2971 domain-containing protein n=1 Tax=Imperialibacter sp. TaxID=2038411 RepID=UPI0032EF97CD
MALDKLDEVKEILLGLFPGLNTSELKFGNKGNGEPVWNHYHVSIPPSNSNFLKSPYFFNRPSVVHFSNVFALTSILSEKSLRLYNLNHLNDPREFTFASKIFDLGNERIKDAKNNLHIMSFCEHEILSGPNTRTEFNMWRLYGNQGKGLALVFSIQNNPEHWNDFHLSKVVYGAKNRRRFDELKTKLESLNATQPTIEVDLSKLYVFHKPLMYDLEKEVRLVFDRRNIRAGLHGRTKSQNGKQVFPIIKTDLHKLTQLGQDSTYLEIPIYFHSSNSFDEDIPVLKLEQIILGYGLNEEIPRITSILREQCKEKIGYIPEIKQSRLHKYYWDSKKK